MNIADNCVVSIHYVLTDDKGAEIDSSTGQEPLRYLHGTHSLIPGLERELTGKAPGDHLKVTVQPADAYGEVNLELIQVIPRSAFGDIEDIQPGMQFEASSPEGQMQLITVTAVNGDEVTIDGNHPLAGQVLHFDVTVEEVRAATDEEIAHGHVH
jgi:FKBP-type peptidyl-prolyl cis-trans isomerase SlyD